MNYAYELLQKQAELNKQLYTLLRFACKCEHVTSLTMNTYESAIVFLAAKCSQIRIFNVGDTPLDTKLIDSYNTIAKDIEIDFKIEKLNENFETTELLYINTPAEGNYRAMELGSYAPKVSKYIILNNTVAHAHKPSSNIKFADGIKPIGLVFGINHFLQENDNWFILEHDDIQPGVTILINKDNISC